MNKIQKYLSVGDTIYSTNGKELTVTKITSSVFFCGEEYYTYDEHRKLYYLTKRGLEESRNK